MKAPLLLALAATAAASLSLPADAQNAPQRTREIIVFGTDPCPRSTDDAVVVCARRPEEERFRLPEALRPTAPSRQATQSWAVRSGALASANTTGPGTCSQVGPGGTTGCALEEIHQGVAERAEQEAAETAPEQ